MRELFAEFVRVFCFYLERRLIHRDEYSGHTYEYLCDEDYNRYDHIVCIFCIVFLFFASMLYLGRILNGSYIRQLIFRKEEVYSHCFLITYYDFV